MNLVWLLAACTGGGDSGTPVCAHDPPLTYDNFGQPYLERYCNGCHSSLVAEPYRNDAPLGIDFDTWEGAVAHADRIQERATGEEPTMPPGGGPTAEDTTDLAEWLTCELLPAQEAEQK